MYVSVQIPSDIHVISLNRHLPTRLQLPLNETLDHSGRCEGIFLKDSLTINNKGVGLDENLSRLQEVFSVKINRRSPRYKPVSSSELDP